MLYAVKYSKSRIVEYLIDQEVNVDAKKDAYGVTALMYAAKNGEYSIVECLIEQGADINV